MSDDDDDGVLVGSPGLRRRLSLEKQCERQRAVIEKLCEALEKSDSLFRDIYKTKLLAIARDLATEGYEITSAALRQARELSDG